MLRTLGIRPWFEQRRLVSRTHSVFDKAGTLTDKMIREQLRQIVHDFVGFISQPDYRDQAVARTSLALVLANGRRQ